MQSRKSPPTLPILVLIPAIAPLTSPAGTLASEGWPQFGGPNRNFMVEAKDLADSWPEGGPRQLWKRELGDGYSTIVVDGDVMYTMYRSGADEFTIALDRKDGKTLWEHKNPSPTTPLMEQFGAGPHTTPLVAGDHVYTIGSNAVMHCYNKKTGDVVWKHDLPKEFGAPIPGRGYGNSPIAYKNTVIVGVDRERGEGEGGEAKKEEKEGEKKTSESQSLVAFDQKTGKVVWKSQDYAITYASPILIQFEGQPQLVLLMEKDIMGVNPDNGELLWHTEVTPTGGNFATPVWNNKDMIFCSSAYDSGSRAIKLTKKDGKTVPEQVWYSRKMRIHHANPIQIGDYVYGSSGDSGPAFFMSVNLSTGEVAWRERGFKKATCVYADEKIILLDEDGMLALLSVNPEGMKVHSQAKVAEPYAWAAPTLVGTKLYVRDRKHIMAFDLGTTSS
jgi:outer membrane protein assembly factor BamB